MRVAVTGADGFLGWHTRCTLKARGDQIVAVDRAVAADEARLEAALRDVDVVLHLAGVNRGATDAALRADNAGLARQLTAALDRAGTRPAVVYANSLQSGNGTPFGDGKQAAAEHLTAWGATQGLAIADVRLPNLFGEHGRPHYNSVIATFCYELARGGTPVVHEDRDVPLLHVQQAVNDLLDLGEHGCSGVFWPRGRPTSVSLALERLREVHDHYAVGDIPDVTDPFDLALFNTYRSYCFPEHFPIRPVLRSDDRGQLFECVRGHGGQTQVFCSTSRPGITRGEHFHLRKVERFMVLRGCAVIALRKLFHDSVVTFTVSGEQPAMIDMPTMWAHSITNTGADELLTLFWAHELLDPADPDTYPESVQDGAGKEVRRG